MQEETFNPKPKKSLGQNFLTSIPARIAMVEAGNVTSSDTILEIGGGKGFLTKELLGRGARVIVVEKDRELVPYLQTLFKEEVSAGQLEVTEGDALTFDPSTYFSKNNPYKLVANIPYYITGAILSKYLSSTLQPSTMAVLVQKEVAERVCARDGKESLLSLSVKVYGDPKVFYRVSRGSFFPIPNVDSAILQIQNISKHNFKNISHEDMFFKLIHAGFAHKRKFALSNIKAVFTETDVVKLFQEVHLSEKVRAEDVPLSLWLSLSEKLSA